MWGILEKVLEKTVQDIEYFMTFSIATDVVNITIFVFIVSRVSTVVNRRVSPVSVKSNEESNATSKKIPSKSSMYSRKSLSKYSLHVQLREKLSIVSC